MRKHITIALAALMTLAVSCRKNNIEKTDNGSANPIVQTDNFIQCPDNPQNFNRYTHWDRPNVSRVCDDYGNYQYDSFTGDFHPATTERYHSPDDMLHSGGVQSLVMNRYDASYCNGGFTYSIINPPVLRYNFGFLFSIRY